MDCSIALFGLYPPPGTSPTFNRVLLQRAAGGSGRSGRVVADNARLVAEEVPLTGLGVLRVAYDRVSCGGAAGAGAASGYRKYVATLYAAGQDGINEAGA